jgi:hypothetical protein
MVLKVPRIIRSPLLICQIRDYSLLGFGDILVPGILKQQPDQITIL